MPEKLEQRKATTKIYGGGEMGELIRNFNWNSSPVGPIESWTDELINTVNICINSPFPVLLSWGQELIKIYNDAFSKIIGKKHPSALGETADKIWPEIEDTISPLLNKVLSDGINTMNENILMFLERNGYPEECYFTFSYSPVFNVNGKVSGVFTIVSDTTEAVINNRHLITLGNISSIIEKKNDIGEVFSSAMKVLESNPYDFPFALLYKLRHEEKLAEVYSAAGLSLPDPRVPEIININDPGVLFSSDFLKSIKSNKYLIIDDIRAKLGEMPGGIWKTAPLQALLLPISMPGNSEPFALLVTGINPHFRINEAHVSFFQLIAEQIGNRVLQITTIEKQNIKLQQTENTKNHIRRIIMEAPVGMAIYKGPDFIVEVANTKALEFWNKKENEIIGKSILDFSVSDRNTMLKTLNEVFYDGKSIKTPEFKSTVEHNGITDELYFNIILEPMRDHNDKIDSILIVASDITELVKSRKIIEENEERLRMALTSTSLGTWDYYPLTGKLHWSEECRKIYMIPENSPIDLEIFSRQIFEDDREWVNKVIFDSMNPDGDGIYDISYRIIRFNDHSVRWIRSQGKVFFNSDRQAERFSGTVLDITEDKKREIFWKESEEKAAKLAAIVQSSNDAIVDKTLKGIITSWNESAERMFGYTSKEMIGQSISKLFPPDRLNEETKIISLLLEKGKINHFETQRITKDNRILDISLTISLVKDDSGNIIGISKIARDITDKKKSERLINENEERLRLAAESADLGTWEMNIETGRIFSDISYVQIAAFKDTHTAINRKAFIKHVDPEHRHIVIKAVKDALRIGKLSFEARLVKDDNNTLWVRVKGKTIYNDSGNPEKIIGTIVDITEHKNFITELQESEQRFKLIADNAPVLIWMLSPEKQFEFINKGWIEFTGKTEEETLGTGWTEAIHSSDFEYCMKCIDEAMQKRLPFSFEFRLRRHDSVYRWFELHGIPRFGADSMYSGYIGSCVDIHTRKLAGEELELIIHERTAEINSRNLELQHQADFVEKMLDASIDIMIVYDKELRFQAFNKACELKYNVSKEDILGKTLFEVFPQAEGSSGHMDLIKAFGGEKIHNPQYKSAVTDRYYEDFLIPLKDQFNETYAVLVIGHDITDTIHNARKLKEINEDLVKSNRDLEQFAYVASHDLQEPLRKIQTFTSMLENQINDEEARKKYFSKINSSARRMSDLIKAVLNYSRLNKSDEKFSEVDLNLVIENIKVDFELLISEKSASVIHGKLPVIMGIPLQINQLFSNLFSNSLKFNTQKPLIKITSTQISGKLLSEFPESDPNIMYHEISFSDNGIGFDQQYVEQVFTIFQRLNDRQMYAGTGIGLALCKKIILNHRGVITAKSETGIGSTFYMYLPVNA